MSLTRLAIRVLASVTVVAIPLAAAAQPTAERGRLIVTVADPSGAVIPNATVRVTRQDAAVTESALAPASTSATGQATLDALAAGRYTIVAEFPGFETVTVKDVRVRAGETRRTITLPLKRIAEDVVVGRDGRTASLDPRGNAFSTVLTREQIEALPDDPYEMEAALRAMAPPGATLRVDGFTGGRLPPKSQIRSIRLPRMDMLAAQNHGGMGGMLHIDILTQPGNGPLRGSFDMTFRDDALNARNPFVPVKGDEGLKQGGVSLSGSLVPGKSSFSLNVQGTRQFNTGNLLAAVPGQTVAEAIRQPTERSSVNARFDQAINKDHMLRASFQRTGSLNRNLGVGGFDLPERGYTNEQREYLLRLSENGAVGRRFFSESRFQARWSRTEATSAVEAQALRVNDAFTSGGAQRKGGSRAVDFEAASDLDYVRGAHSMRTGVLVEGGRYRSTDASNYLGTYTFASLADFEAGRPSNFSRRIGDADVEYTNFQIGLYGQNDQRLTKSLMLSYGVRYETENLLGDRNNVSPRVSVTWSPLASGRTTFRGGWGYFTDWLGAQVYEQTLRVDGTRQREINVANPSFPEVETDVAALPSNRYQLSDALRLPASQMANVGVDQQLGPVRVSATYTRRLGINQLRGRNLNAPAAADGGVRPDPRFANIVEVVGDAEQRLHSFGVNAALIKLDWRQTFLVANYSFSSARTNSTGPFGLPANGDDLSTEWGPSGVRHRVGFNANMRPWTPLSVAVNARWTSGAPYNVTTGRDDNGDGVFGDRPAGVSRNAAVGDSQWDVGLRVSYGVSFGPPVDATGGGGGGMVVIRSGDGGMPGGMGGGAGTRRFRLEFYASAQNLTNHLNYVGYSGVVTSPFFGLPTNVMNPRKIELGIRVGF